MRSLVRRAWKPLVPAVLLLLTVVPLGRADASIGPCGYASVTINGTTRTVPLVTSCTRADCAGLSAGPFGAGLGSNAVWEYTCVRA